MFMSPDEEVVFGRVYDEVHSSYERVRALMSQTPSAEYAIALAEFELHGSTLRSLERWYPSDARVREALAEWEELSTQTCHQQIF